MATKPLSDPAGAAAAGPRAGFDSPAAHPMDVVPIIALTEPSQRFRCAPLRAVLTAGACVGRQDAVLAAGRNRDGTVAKANFPQCRECPDGKRVRAGVGDVPPGWRPSAPPLPPAPPRRAGRPTYLPPPPDRASRETAAARLNALFAERPKPVAPAAPTPPATCARPNCARPVARVRKNTRPEERSWCRYHRHVAQKNRTPSARVVRALAEGDAAARALHVVELLGGIERAERISAAIGGRS
jgi:hypothetical protein